MIVIDSVSEFRSQRAKLVTGSLGFVPTMGALHAGHASLIKRSVAECDKTLLTIYVNPTQFNKAADLDAYPETLDADLALAEELGVDIVLLPTYEEIYPDGYRYQIDETEFSRNLCGEHRPGHFTGVLTVVMKLFNLVKPDKAYFGEKDYQQCKLIKDMVEAFFLDVDIVACETCRESDGLAMSSRNLNLTEAQRFHAPSFRQNLIKPISDAEVTDALNQDGFEVDYIKTIDNRRYGAATLGRVRLIDNTLIGEESE